MLSTEMPIEKLMNHGEGSRRDDKREGGPESRRPELGLGHGRQALLTPSSLEQVNANKRSMTLNLNLVV